MAHVEAKPLGGKIFSGPAPYLFLAGLIGIYFLAIRYILGIGAVSNLTDYMPWGVWKVLNVIVGAALVCGGYACAFTVYIFNQGHYHRFVRPALLLSLLGYSFAGLSLFYDVGRYWGLFNFLFPKYWQGNSVLFEVALCVMSYNCVLFLEISPAILEKFSAAKNERLRRMTEKLHHFLDRFLFVVIAFGVLLPTMHQSGLGGIAVVMGSKISPLWQTPYVALLHLLSCIAMGYGCVMVTEILFFDTTHNLKLTPLFETIAKLMRWFVYAFLALRWIEIIRAGALGKAFMLNLDSLSFWMEMAMFIVGIYLIRTKELRLSLRNIFYSGCLVMAAGSLYRFNVYIIGYHPAEGISYFPSAPELLISLGMISLQLFIFITIAKIFPIFGKKEEVA